MKIKTKLTFGVGLLFLMIFLLAALGGWYVNLLKKDTNNILAANYNTVLYSRNMLIALEDLAIDTSAFTVFQENLDKQSENATEPGEQEANNQVIKHFKFLQQNPADSVVRSSIRKDITELMRLNMDAIERKSVIADDTAEKAIIVISIVGTLCFLIAFILLVNLPSNIADPIKELSESIRQIANQNYKRRVNFESHSEFGDLARSFNTMAEKIEEYSESKLDRILKGKKRIEALIDNMHDAVIGIDESRKVLFVNEVALKITGLERKDFIDKQIQDVAVVNDLVRDIIKDIILPKEKKGKAEPIKIFADNKESYFEKEIVDINIVPTGEDASEFIGQVIILKNVTPFKELDLAKTNFIGTVSHEFKTPIASIQMGVELLQNKQLGTLNDEQTSLVGSIKEDVNRLLKITSELLNITQVESGSIQINILPTAIKPIIEYAIDANKAAADQKQVVLKVTIEDGLNEVMADSEKTAWVLTNLLSNAIRYSYENATVEIGVQKNNGKVKFSVTDTGQGIQAQYLEKIFERYFRIPGTKKEGTGLGLSISKEFIEAQGGEIRVQSEYAAGSTFTFLLSEVRKPQTK